MENSIAFEGLNTVQDLIEYLNRIERFKEITFSDCGTITWLRGLPRGLDLMFCLWGYIMPEMIDDDWKGGVVYLIHTSTNTQKSIRLKIDDLHELHTATMSLIRRMYLIRENRRQSILNTNY